MKFWGKVLLVLALVCAACGAYSYYVVANARVESLMGISFDEAAALVRTGHVSFTQNVMLFAVENRLTLLVGGLAATLGILVGNKAKA